MTTHCRECYVEIPPTARTGCCKRCRPVRRHSSPRQTPRREADAAYRRLRDEHATQ